MRYGTKTSSAVASPVRPMDEVNDKWRASTTQQISALDTSALPNSRIGIEYRNLHTLRHTAASLLLANGGDLFCVQQVLGHSQLALIADLYGHAVPALLEDVAERTDRTLGG